MPLRYSVSMSPLERALTDIALWLEVLREIKQLVEITPELQEGENRQAINEFREKMINKLLAKLETIPDY